MSVSREDIFRYVREKYGTEPEYLWLKTPDAAVLRNSVNNKWYGLIMNISAKSVGIEDCGHIDILNVKCSANVREVLIGEGKAIPAYHMNKRHWITIPLSRKISEKEICGVIDESYEIIAASAKRSKLI